MEINIIDENAVQTDSGPSRILVIEDDQIQRFSIVTTLKNHGVTDIVAVATEQEALDELCRGGKRFDITLCDLRLTDSHAIDFLLKANSDRLGLILLHSILSFDIISATIKFLTIKGVSITAYLPKPLDFQSLCEIYTQKSNKSWQNKPSNDIEPTELSFSKEELLDAISSGQFIPYFQPLIDLQSHDLYGVECLARWVHPTHGVLPPGSFFPSLIEHDLMNDFSKTVINSCFRLLSESSEFDSVPKISVNISADMLKRPDFVDNLIDIASSYGLERGRVILELTESEFLADDALWLEKVTKLRILGFGVALDDYGVGYTTLNQIRQLPITELKIDRSYVSNINRSQRGMVMLDALLYIASELALCSIAEGIETAADAEVVKELGCKVGQGYYFARPMPIEKLEYWLRGNRAPLDAQ